ncbi:MAG: hypothetical protein AAF655_12305 [Bacteroidota bacterium]
MRSSTQPISFSSIEEFSMLISTYENGLSRIYEVDFSSYLSN